jgi:hypothetical protein
VRKVEDMVDGEGLDTIAADLPQDEAIARARELADGGAP